MDFETHLQLKETEAALAKQHSEYLAAHPEINFLLNDFVSDFLLKKPSDILTLYLLPVMLFFPLPH
jgi:hypothetical protein